MNKVENIELQYLPSISRIFSPIVLDNLVNHGYSDYLSEVSTNSGLTALINPSSTLREFLNEVYQLLLTRYRSEYIYKNTIVNKLLLGKHSLNTSHVLTELRIGRNKADIVLLNGTSTVYEIKSEFDSLTRLKNQIGTYNQVFDHINVITSESHVNNILPIIPRSVGILVLTNRNSISTIRKSSSNNKYFNSDIAFSSLRKNEYLQIISEYFGYTPELPNTLIFEECRKLFRTIPKEISRSLFTKVLKERKRSKTMVEFLKTAPSSLSAYAISIGDQESKILRLMTLLDKDFITLTRERIS